LINDDDAKKMQDVRWNDTADIARSVPSLDLSSSSVGMMEGRVGMDASTSGAGAAMSASAGSQKRVRVLVVGDSGSGKTSLTRAVSSGASRALGRDEVERTVGCRVEVVLVDGTNGGERSVEDPGTREDFFVEMWDVGGHRQYARERGIFYDRIDGVIIVHDASIRASGARCEAWAREVANRGTFSAPMSTPPAEAYADGTRPNILYGFGGLPVPCLIVANKIDLEGSGGVLRGSALGLMQKILSSASSRRGRASLLPETIGDVQNMSAKPTHHRRTSSFGAAALAKLPPGGGLRTSVVLGRVDFDEIHGFFHELVSHRYSASSSVLTDTAPSAAPERLLRTVPSLDDYDDLT
jgi:GTPase SAR1 family protein